MNALKLICLVATLGALGSPLSGQDAAESPMPKELAQLDFTYQVAIAEDEKGLKALATHYLNRLEKVRVGLQNRGALEGVLAVEKEAELVAKTGDSNPTPILDDEPQELIDSRRIYERARDGLIPGVIRAKTGTIAKHRQDLSALQQQYTRAGRIEDAVETKKILESLPTKNDLVGAPLRTELKIKLQIDGLSYLMLRGDEIWYDHTGGRASPPGLHEGNHPTYLDGDTEWMPEWVDGKTAPYDIQLGLRTEEPAQELNLRNAAGRGYAKIIDQPTAANDYTARILLLDEDRGGKRFGGSEWIEFRLEW